MLVRSNDFQLVASPGVDVTEQDDDALAIVEIPSAGSTPDLVSLNHLNVFLTVAGLSEFGNDTFVCHSLLDC
ncbi:hypothetical protein D3C72_2302100 [compost metagenome]